MFDDIQYTEQIHISIKSNLFLKNLNNKKILISGATGMIGTYIVDILMILNTKFEMNINIMVLSRNEKRIKERFGVYLRDLHFKYKIQDVNSIIDLEDYYDYVIHAASNTHPKQYATDPIGTITTNIIGTKNLLDYSIKRKVERFLFLSSVEIYGENYGNIDRFKEDSLGFINCNTLRAGYPESKRTGEALCQAYRNKYNIETVIARISRTYGPTMHITDSKAISQFIIKAVLKENIILKSEGNQRFSYIYALDAAMASLFILINGKDGEAYNVVDESSDISLFELATFCAKIGDSRVIFSLPDRTEAKGYSTVTRGLLNGEKLRRLSWSNQYNIKNGINCTIEILRRIYSNEYEFFKKNKNM